MIQFNYDGNSAPDTIKPAASHIDSKGISASKQRSINVAPNKKLTCKETGSGIVCELVPKCENRMKQLTVYQARQINGCLIRAPTTFYSDIW